MPQAIFFVLLSIFTFHQGSSYTLPCQFANGDPCTPTVCPGTEVKLSCTVPSLAVYTEWTIPEGYCSSSAPLRLDRVPTCATASCGPFTANCITTTCLTSTLSVVVPDIFDTLFITCSYFTQNATMNVGNATIYIAQYPAGADFGAYNGWALPNQPCLIILAWDASYATFPSNYIITINGSTVVLPSSSSGYIVPSPIVGAVYNIYLKAINCLGSNPLYRLNFTVNETVGVPFVFSNITVMENNPTNATISCSFLHNQTASCVVCCSTSLGSLFMTKSILVSGISSTIETEVTVDLYGLTSGQTYYCLGGVANTPVTLDCSKNVEFFDVFFSFDTPMLPTPTTTTIAPTITSEGAFCTSQPVPLPVSDRIAIGVGVGIGVVLMMVLVVVLFIVVIIRKKKDSLRSQKDDKINLFKAKTSTTPKYDALYQSGARGTKDKIINQFPLL